MSADKRALRQELREQRKHLPASVVQAAAVAVCSRLLGLSFFQAATAVAVYVADENEIPTDMLIHNVGSTGRDLYLPRDAGRPVLVRWQPGAPLRRARGGVQEPLDGVPAVMDLPAVIVLPLVAWDHCGTRLGRGGGFYDRLLADLDPRVLRVGLAYEFQGCPELPRDPWDISMHRVITERRVIVCGDGRAASFQKGGLQS